MRSYMTDHRTPMAWKHRDMTLQSNGPQRNGHSHHHHHHHHHRPPPSPTITTSSSDEREEVPMVRSPLHHHHRRPHSRGNRFRDVQSQFSAADPYPSIGPPFRTGGTLRSTRSVPALALATWDGEPCPVHGHGVPLFHHQHPHNGLSNAGTMRRHGSLFDVRLPYFGHPPFGPPVQFPAPPTLLEKKSFHGSMQLNPYMVPPMMRPRPYVIPAGAEPLPVRDPYKMGRTPPASAYAGSKADDAYSVDQVCCKGHLIVLWIILAVVTVGVILGIVLGVTIA
ncbi:uncharacterized protein LOC129218249 [Uloborus diversus]|uniref:uncharacterized protein LOC129218249 n=1 Tax=Uloborus diversus TaxID=327109 RepID=UPI00240A1009|nr:uncharacterized protein LOC129218249 [Uloborus diversus]